MENKCSVTTVLDSLTGRALLACPLQPSSFMLNELLKMRSSVIEQVFVRRRAGVAAQPAVEVSLVLHGGLSSRCTITGGVDDQASKLLAQALIFKSCGDREAVDAAGEDESSIADYVWLAASIALCKAVAAVEGRALYEVIRPRETRESSCSHLPLPILALFPQEAVYFVPNRSSCRSLRACFELFSTVYWTLRREMGLEESFVDGAFMSVNALSPFTSPALVAQLCQKRFPAHFGVAGLRGTCAGAALSTIDGDGSAMPKLTEVSPTSAKVTGTTQHTTALVRWESYRNIAAIQAACASVAARGLDVCLVGSTEHGGHGDDGPLALPHLAIGVQAKYIFVGPPCGSHHVAVYNELIRIEERIVEKYGSSHFL